MFNIERDVNPVKRIISNRIINNIDVPHKLKNILLNKRCKHMFYIRCTKCK